MNLSSLTIMWKCYIQWLMSLSMAYPASSVKMVLLAAFIANLALWPKHSIYCWHSIRPCVFVVAFSTTARSQKMQTSTAKEDENSRSTCQAASTNLVFQQSNTANSTSRHHTVGPVMIKKWDPHFHAPTAQPCGVLLQCQIWCGCSLMHGVLPQFDFQPC